MKTLKLFSLFLLAFVLSDCGTTDPGTSSGASVKAVRDVARTLDTAYKVFYDLTKSNAGNTPGEVNLLLAEKIKGFPNVKSVDRFDSLNLLITMNSGLRSYFILNLIDDKKKSISRGGEPTAKRDGKIEPLSVNHISNKNVLIYAPFYECKLEGDFYDDGYLNSIAEVFHIADPDFNVTILKCGECSVDAIKTFKDYGLVIINTHGMPNGFLTGQIMKGLTDQLIADDGSFEAELKKQFGENGPIQFFDGFYSFAQVTNLFVSNWKQFALDPFASKRLFQVVAMGKFISSIPSMPGTVVFGNMCYSGWNNTLFAQEGQHFDIEDPIRKAFLSRDPIAYYGYGYDDGTSKTVDNTFAVIMEDTLVHSLAADGDSTGNAHLDPSGNNFTGAAYNIKRNGDLPLKQYGKKDYSYEDCVKEFTDDRDGETYKAVCIGDQNWMAENLRYAAPGSICYNNDDANCEKYGRLYNRATVMNGASASSASPSGVKGVCPNGWHLPSTQEWQTLYATLGGPLVAGGAMKSIDTSWQSPNVGATNSSGFSALPTGLRTTPPNFPPKFSSPKDLALWWTSSEDNLVPPNPHDAKLLSNFPEAFIDQHSTDYDNHLACRCVKDK